jgi:hypothetical protein
MFISNPLQIELMARHKLCELRTPNPLSKPPTHRTWLNRLQSWWKVEPRVKPYASA